MKEVNKFEKAKLEENSEHWRVYKHEKHPKEDDMFKYFHKLDSL